MKVDVTDLNLEDSGEYGFLMKSWKGALLVEEKYSKGCCFAMVEEAVKKVRERGGRFVCARNPKRVTQIFGFAVIEDDVVHFAYVKRWFREHGIASELLKGCRYATFWSEAATPLFKKLQIKRIDL